MCKRNEQKGKIIKIIRSQMNYDLHLFVGFPCQWAVGWITCDVKYCSRITWFKRTEESNRPTDWMCSPCLPDHFGTGVILNLSKGEVLTNTNLDRFVNNIWEKWIFCVYRKSFRSLSSAHEKWEQKQKCCEYVFVQTIFRSYCYLLQGKYSWIKNSSC